METILLAAMQVVIVTVVYFVAYRSGYRAANAKAASTVQAFAKPVEEFLEKMSQSVGHSTEAEPRNGRL